MSDLISRQAAIDAVIAWTVEKGEERMNEIQFYIPESETIPTDLRLYVNNVYVEYRRIDGGFRFDISLADEVEAMKIAEAIVEKMIFESYDHGASKRTVSLNVIQQDERYKVSTVIDWLYRVRDSY